MGIEKAAQYGLVGFIADRILGTGGLATIGAALFGGLMKPDSGEMSEAYDRRRATIGQTLKNFGGFEMPDLSFLGGGTKESVRPSRERAETEATRREQSGSGGGFPWKKLLLGGAAAWLGVNLLDNLMVGPFSRGMYAPYGNWGGRGILGNLGASLFGYNRMGFLC